MSDHGERVELGFSTLPFGVVRDDYRESNPMTATVWLVEHQAANPACTTPPAAEFGETASCGVIHKIWTDHVNKRAYLVDISNFVLMDVDIVYYKIREL